MCTHDSFTSHSLGREKKREWQKKRMAIKLALELKKKKSSGTQKPNSNAIQKRISKVTNVPIVRFHYTELLNGMEWYAAFFSLYLCKRMHYATILGTWFQTFTRIIRFWSTPCKTTNRQEKKNKLTQQTHIHIHWNDFIQFKRSWCGRCNVFMIFQSIQRLWTFSWISFFFCFVSNGII